MTSAAVTCNWFFAPGEHVATLRAVGLVALAIGAYFAFFTPRWLKDRQRARMAQLSVSLYTVLTVVGGGAMVLVAKAFSPSWFPQTGIDRLSSSGAIMLLSTTLLIGALLASNSTRTFTNASVSMQALLAFPILAAVAMDAWLLGYFWLGPTVPTSAAACSTGPVGSGEIGVASFSAVIAVLMLTAAIVPMLRDRSARAIATRALLPAGVGAIVEVGLVVLRGPAHWASTSSLAGIDVMLVCAVIGIWVFMAGFRAGRSTFTPEPVRLGTRWFTR